MEELAAALSKSLIDGGLNFFALIRVFIESAHMPGLASIGSERFAVAYQRGSLLCCLDKTVAKRILACPAQHLKDRVFLHRLAHLISRVLCNHANQLIEVALEEFFQFWTPLYPQSELGQLFGAVFLRSEDADLRGIRFHFFQCRNRRDIQRIAIFQAKFGGGTEELSLVVALFAQLVQHDIQVAAYLDAVLLKPVQGQNGRGAGA